MPDLAGWLERLCATQETVKCYLCLERVSEKQWTSGRHRVQVLQFFTLSDWSTSLQCVRRNRVRLGGFLQHPSLACRQCGRRLRLWPDQVGTSQQTSQQTGQLTLLQGTLFVCNSDLSSCTSRGQSRAASGGSRYNCYLCDHDICLGCKAALEEQELRARASSSTCTVLRAGTTHTLDRVTCLKTLCEQVRRPKYINLQLLH